MNDCEVRGSLSRVGQTNFESAKSSFKIRLSVPALDNEMTSGNVERAKKESDYFHFSYLLFFIFFYRNITVFLFLTKKPC